MSLREAELNDTDLFLRFAAANQRAHLLEGYRSAWGQMCRAPGLRVWLDSETRSYAITVAERDRVTGLPQLVLWDWGGNIESLVGSLAPLASTAGFHFLVVRIRSGQDSAFDLFDFNREMERVSRATNRKVGFKVREASEEIRYIFRDNSCPPGLPCEVKGWRLARN